jgi:hypothetical protein
MPRTYSNEEVISHIHAECNKTSLRNTAARKGVSPAYLSDVIRGNRQISERVAEAFGFERDVVTKVIFRRKL